MRTSEKPTAFVLVRAGTISEWDHCDFAIIHISEEWKTDQLKRMEAVDPFKEDYAFQGASFYAPDIEYFRKDDNDSPDIDNLLQNGGWTFIELDTEDEMKQFEQPENSLDCHTIRISSDGCAIYKAFGKYSNEEFWTEFLPLADICQSGK